MTELLTPRLLTRSKMNQSLLELFEVQDGNCFYCEEKMFPPEESSDANTGLCQMHIFSRKFLGKHLVNNIVLIHPACKSNRNEEEPAARDIEKGIEIYEKLGRIAFYSPISSRPTPAQQCASLKDNRSKKLFDAQNGQCFLCHKDLGPNWNRDHVLPQSSLGRWVNKNVVLVHPRCNYKKGNQLPTLNEIERTIILYEKIGESAFYIPIQEYLKNGKIRYADHLTGIKFPPLWRM